MTMVVARVEADFQFQIKGKPCGDFGLQNMEKRSPDRVGPGFSFGSLDEERDSDADHSNSSKMKTCVERFKVPVAGST